MIVNISGKTAWIGDLILYPRMGLLSDYKMCGGVVYLVDQYTFNKYKDIRPDIVTLNEYNKFICSDFNVCRKINRKVELYAANYSERISC